MAVKFTLLLGQKYLGLSHEESWKAVHAMVASHTTGLHMPTFKGHGHTDAHVSFYLKTHAEMDFSNIIKGLCLDTVEAVKNIKQPKAIYSHGPKPYVLQGLHSMGMDESFDVSHVFGLDTVGMDHLKTTEKGYKKVLESIGAVAEKSVMVEDTIYNLVSAKKLGMKTVLIDHKGKYEGHEHLVHVDHVYEDFT